MEKLKNGRYQIASAEEVIKAVEEIEGYIEKYGWQDKVVKPYNAWIKLPEFIKPFKDYERYTYSSKEVMLSELNGLIEYYINPWLKREAEPKITVKLITNGKIKTVPKSIAESYFEMELAEPVK